MTLQLESTTPEKMLSLIKDLADLPCSIMQKNLNKYIESKSGANISFLAPILPESEEMVIHVVGGKILDRGLRIPINQSNASDHVLHRVIKTRKSLKVNCTELDQELLLHLNSVSELVPDKLLSIPIEHPSEQYIALVVTLINYPDDEAAEDLCIKIVEECFRYCLGLLLNTLRCQEETRLKVQCQDLLTVSRKLFTHLGDLPDLLREIMVEARKLTKAERCSLFLLDHEHHELVAKVFDGISTTDEMRIALDQGIAGHVATSGKLINIRNAYEHPLFYSGIDEVTGFKTRNILCFPIRDENQIIGVAQLCNKTNGLYFDVCDEEVATAFSIYCGISIMHSIIYKKIQDSQARSKLSNELMMYHMKVEEEAVQALLNCRDDHSPKDFDQFHFRPRNIPHQHTPCYVLKMFDELDLITLWRIKRKTLARFILYVKKGYRDAPYHNWVHAFSVAHFAYLMIKNLNLVKNNYMTRLQSLVFLVSGLCHDIDHRGTNNSFQTQCGTVLASLYSSEGSVMERHHLAQSMCILNTEGCNIFENLTSDEYSEALDLLRNNILATDLASHFRSIDEQDEMVKKGFDYKDPVHQKLLHAMFMTCCDLSDQTKDWRTSKKTAEQIYDEFFSQGDLEKSMGTAPIEMMDRERASIPDLQVQFITNLVLPLFENLSTLFTTADCLVEAIKRNREIWRIAIPIFHRYSEMGIKGMDILLDQNIENEILTAYRTQTLPT
ncbi:cGMP-dependent 3',5'-cyclic phosphodiesterase [Microplitis demolitor]|uniref:cGMP-dependent 3',5'-cyclic phosphodiesterase n=1 Tax=Microplitis demolitor TaxID=69319 RepID=UPI0006D51756|nr:cGMP-dependent 3',5'-cyclic phosphodiesterase [Microplitis demolitor]